MESYEVGMVVKFNRKTAGFQKGELTEVVAVKESGVILRDAHGPEKRLPPQVETFDVQRKKSLEITPGDRLLIRANDRRQKILNGEIVTVSSIEAGNLHLADGRSIDLNRFRQISHGYVVTSHNSQSKTAEHVVVAASRMDAKATYVGCSRGRLSCTVHTPDKSELFRQLPLGGRTAALDLVSPSKAMPERASLVVDRTLAWSKSLVPDPITKCVAFLGRAWPWISKGLPIVEAINKASRDATPPYQEREQNRSEVKT